MKHANNVNNVENILLKIINKTKQIAFHSAKNVSSFLFFSLSFFSAQANRLMQ